MSHSLFGRSDGSPGVHGRFAGDLSRFSTLDLAQTLMLARKTGLLTVRNGDRSGFFFFKNGEIVSVMDDSQRQGMQAALHLFLWKDGSFEFDFDKVPPEGTLGVPTENLLMEAARQMDEAARDRLPLEGGEERAPAVVENPLDGIREIFARIVDRAMPHAARARRGKGIDGLIARMNEEEADSLQLFSGLSPRLVARTRVIPLEAAPVEASDVERLILAALDPLARRELERTGVAEGVLEASNGLGLRAVATVYGGRRALSLHMPRTVPAFPESDAEVQSLLEELPLCFLAFGEPDSIATDFAASAIHHLSQIRKVGAAWFSRRAAYRFPADKGFVVSYPLVPADRASLAFVSAAIDRGARIVGVADASPALLSEIARRTLLSGGTLVATVDSTLAGSGSPLRLPAPFAEPVRGAFEVAPGGEGSPFTVVFHPPAGES
ncbi:MAG: DUF4388 domain-containing protein [Planctomycetes bacterium]|nr:DUF4388 domain-containing protein [Planctomycetota bacterium]MBI3844349.1 DUF4388 domain-containing protein [Planctomycetota bacterium]